jgi:hypothetical protein
VREMEEKSVCSQDWQGEWCGQSFEGIGAAEESERKRRSESGDVGFIVVFEV